MPDDQQCVRVSVRFLSTAGKLHAGELVVRFSVENVVDDGWRDKPALTRRLRAHLRSIETFEIVGAVADTAPWNDLPTVVL